MNEVSIRSAAAERAVFVTSFEITVGVESEDAKTYSRMIGTNMRVRVRDVGPAVDGLYGCVRAVDAPAESNRSMITFTFSKDVEGMPDHAEGAGVSLHVPAEDHVNLHPFCLHLWRPQDVEIPRPPAWMVGPKPGQSLADSLAEGVQAQVADGGNLTP